MDGRALFGALLVTSLACAQSPEDFLECGDACDVSGPLTINTRWAPEGGFLRALLDGRDLTLAVEPAADVQLEDERAIVTFGAEGFYVVSAMSGTRAVASFTIRVSDEGPQLDVSSDLADRFSSSSTARVTGVIRDHLGPLRDIRVNGRSATSPLDEQITTQNGLNIITVEATDQAGNVFVKPLVFASASRFESGRQPVVIDLAPSGLAQIAQAITEVMPALLADIPPEDPISEGLVADIFLDTIDVPGSPGVGGSTVLTLQPADGAIHAGLTLSGQSTIGGRVETLVTREYQAFVQNMNISAVARFGSSQQGPRPTVEDVRVTSDGTDLSVDSLIPNVVFEWLAGNLHERVANAVGSALPDWLGKVFQGTDEAFNVPIIGTGKDVKGAFQFSSVGVQGNRSILQLSTSLDVANDGGEGAGIYEPVADPPAAQGDALHISLNALNQYGYALWRHGAFNHHLTEADLADAIARVPQLAPLNPVVNINTRAALPPMATTVDGELLVGATAEADIQLATDLFQVTLKVRIAGSVAVDGTVSAGRLEPTLALRELHIETSRSAFAGLNPRALSTFLEQIAPEVIESVVREHVESIKLPVFDLELIKNTGEIGFDNADVSFTDSYITIEGVIGRLR